MQNKKINIENPVCWDFHRSGWKFVVKNLIKNFHNPNGVYLSTHFESHVAKNIPIKKNWIGFLHNTPHHPECMCHYKEYNNSLEKISKSKVWLESKQKCKGLFVLSKYCKEWIEQNMFENVEKLAHPKKFQKCFSACLIFYQILE